MRWQSFPRSYLWVALVVIAAIFLFYWYEIRPISVYRSCSAQASVDARQLLRNKADISQNSGRGNPYATLIDKNMYLRTDYESFLRKCLLYYGLQDVTADPEDNQGIEDPAGEAAQ